MYTDNRVTIERATNGYTITMRDPVVVAQNRKNELLDYKDPKRKPYRDPDKSYVFTDLEALTTFLTSNLDKALPEDEYSTSFDTIAAEDDD